MDFKNLMNHYTSKLKLLIREPRKIKHLPDFLRIQKDILSGTSSYTIDGLTAKFRIRTELEARRTNNLAGEKEYIEQIIKNIGEGDIFYDIGANIGTHSCFAGLSGGKAYGFEPFEENFDSLKKNLKLNSIEGEAFKVALMNKNSSMSLQKKSGDPGQGEISVSENGEPDTEVYKGDYFIESKNIPEPKVMKIDVEGAELEVLKGLENTLDSTELRTIFVEIHPSRIKEFGGSSKELKDLLREKGFKIEELSNRGEQQHIRATRS